MITMSNGMGETSMSGVYGEVKVGSRVYHLKGETILVKNGKVFINGKPDNDGSSDESNIEVVSITVIGDCKSVSTESGNIHVEGNILGDAKTMSGDIKSKRIGGSASTLSGDVYKK